MADASITARIRGSLVALVTPFKGGAVDEGALKRLIEWHIAEGTHGLVPVGTTGESPTLSHEEHERVIELTVEIAAGRVPVIAGAGSNNTAEMLRFVRHAEAVGADATLIVTPYYNKPNQRMLHAHYAAANEATTRPIIIYNIPGRSVVDMTTETMADLAKLSNIVGVKDATGDLARVSFQRQHCGKDFVQLSGEDATALVYNAGGGVGCISVTANIAPKLCAMMQEATLRGDFAAALEIQDRLLPLHKALFLETNPAGPKYALSLLGMCEPDVRAPLLEITDETAGIIRDAMKHAGVLD